MGELKHNNDGICAIGNATEGQKRAVLEYETMKEDETVEEQTIREIIRTRLTLRMMLNTLLSIMVDKYINVDEDVDNEVEIVTKQKGCNIEHDDCIGNRGRCQT